MTKNKEAENLKNYQPLEGPSNWQLNLGLWWIEYRPLLKRILVGFLILAGASSLGYGIYGFADYYYRGLKEDEQLAELLITTPAISHNFIKSRSASELIIGSVDVLSGAGGIYDLAARIKNPNTGWYANFEYFFVVGQNTTETRREYIMPQEGKYLAEFLYKGPRPSDVGLEVINIDWQRADLSRFSAFDRSLGMEQFVQERVNIKTSGIEFKPGQSSEPPLNTLNFTVANKSSFNYWEVDFFITLQSGNRLLGLNKYKVEKLLSGESRSISIVWPGRFSSPQVQIITAVNIFDEDNYISFELGPGQLK